jgi:hypothetical protein
MERHRGISSLEVMVMIRREPLRRNAPRATSAVVPLIALFGLWACGADEETTGTSTAVQATSAEAGIVIDETAVAQMDLARFDEALTNASDQLVERLGGDLPAFCALLLALDRGYDAYQMLAGALNNSLEADGRVLAADGSVLVPVRAVEGIIDLGGDIAASSAGAAPGNLATDPVLLACLSMPVLIADVDPASLPENAQISSNLRTLAQLYDHFEEVKQGIRRQEAEEARRAQEALAEQERQKAQEEQQKREASWSQQRMTSILSQLFASGYSAEQIVGAIILGKCEPTRDTWGETVERLSSSTHWTLIHTSGGVLRPVHEPVTLSDGPYGPRAGPGCP